MGYSQKPDYNIFMLNKAKGGSPGSQQPLWFFSVPELDDKPLQHQIVSAVIDGFNTAYEGIGSNAPYTLCLSVSMHGQQEFIEVEDLRRFAISKGIHQVFGALEEVVPWYLYEVKQDLLSVNPVSSSELTARMG